MVKSDIEIAREATQKPIAEIGDRLGIPPEALLPYGHTKAKIDLGYIDSLSGRRDGRLVLVTAITPTPAGEGKTTTSVGLADGLNRIGKDTLVCLREPSLGPCFGVKGGAAGGGYAQVVPMEDINLHFTGDFHAIGAANNLLAAMLDNHLHQGNALGLDARRVSWRRVVDMNDRALREIVCSLGGIGNGYPRSDGFDITVASEVMAIFCLASDLEDLQRRLGNIVVGQTRARESITARDLKADGAMTVLLKDALAPNGVDRLRTLAELILWWLGRSIRAAARGELGTMAEVVPGERASAAMLDGAALDRWVGVWENLRRSFADADGLNLEPRQVLIGAFTTLQEAARARA